MRKRLGYLAVFTGLLLIEICIAVFVHDGFIRPYIGDVLVTVLLCCLSRTVFSRFSPALPVFALAAAVEGLQWLGLTRRLGLEGTALGIALGATFDWADICCYAVGCLLFWAVEQFIRK